MFGTWRYEDAPFGETGGILFYIKGLRGSRPLRRISAGYFLRRWCILEFLIIIVQVLDIYISLLPKELQFTDPGLFKGLRAVRIIRLLSNLQNMQLPESPSWEKQKIYKDYAVTLPTVKFTGQNPIKTIMLALGASLPSIFLLMVIAFAMLVMFSLIGMEQFAGLLSACKNDDDMYNTATLCTSDSQCFPGYPGQCSLGLGVCMLDQQHCYGNKLVIPSIYSSTNWRGANAETDFVFPEPRTWVSSRLNFDTAPEAFFSTFCSVSRSGVAFLMRTLGSISARTNAPLSDGSPNSYSFVIILNLLVGVFICQVVIGIILTNLQLKSGYAFHTKEQLVWPATKNMFDRYMPDPKVYPLETGSNESSSKSVQKKPKHPLQVVVSYFQSKLYT